MQNPNDLNSIIAAELAYHKRNQKNEAFEFMLKCYRNDTISPTVKGILSLHLIMNYLANDTFNISTRNIFSFDIENDPVLKTIYKSVPELLQSFILRKNLINSLKHNQLDIHNSPHYIIALPKSASSLVGFCAGQMISAHHGSLEQEKPEGRRVETSWSDFGIANDWELRLDIGADFGFALLRGSIYKGHMEPLGKNLAVLDMYPFSRYILWFRDPRDQLVAMLCHVLKKENTNCRYMAIFPFDHDRVRNSTLEDALSYLITEGWLFHVLLYIAKWMLHRDEKKSIILTYEQLMENPMKCLSAISQLLELNISNAQTAEIYAECNQITNQTSETVNEKFYPKGWSGRIGVWKDYFSDTHRKQFRSVVETFLASFSWGAEIAKVYPELIEAS